FFFDFLSVQHVDLLNGQVWIFRIWKGMCDIELNHLVTLIEDSHSVRLKVIKGRPQISRNILDLEYFHFVNTFAGLPSTALGAASDADNLARTIPIHCATWAASLRLNTPRCVAMLRASSMISSSFMIVIYFIGACISAPLL